MPFSYRITADGLGILYTGRGLVTGKEIVESHSARNENLEASAGHKYGLTDFSGVTDLKVSMPEVHQIAELDARALAWLNQPVTAVIIAPQDLSYGLSRVWEALLARLDVSTHVFRTRAEAEAWLKGKHPEIQFDSSEARGGPGTQPG